MLIEYKFKFEKNGLTLTQRVEPSDSDPHSNKVSFVDSNFLKTSYQESKQANAHPESKSGGGPNGKTGPGGGPNGKTGPGGGGFGTAPVTFIGPFIMCCPHDDSEKHEKWGKG